MEALLKRAIEFDEEYSGPITCRLLSLKCYRSSERDGDEVFLKFEGTKIWPKRSYQSIKATEEIELDVKITSESRGFIRIDLWDKDFLVNDLLGFFQFVAAGPRGTYTTDLRPCDKDLNTRYVLTWET